MRGLAFEDRAELLHVLLAHALEEVEALGVVGRARSERSGGDHPIGHERGCGERVRAAARDPPDTEPLNTQRIANGGDVGRAVGDLPALIPRRAAVPRTVIREEANTTLRRVACVRLIDRARTGRARDEEDREALRVAALTNGERAPIRRSHRPHRAILRRGSATTSVNAGTVGMRGQRSRQPTSDGLYPLRSSYSAPQARGAMSGESTLAQATTAPSPLQLDLVGP